MQKYIKFSETGEVPESIPMILDAKIKIQNVIEVPTINSDDTLILSFGGVDLKVTSHRKAGNSTIFDVTHSSEGL